MIEDTILDTNKPSRLGQRLSFKNVSIIGFIIVFVMFGSYVLLKTFAATPPNPPPENVTFWYQPLSATTDPNRIGKASIVVIADQGSDADEVAAVAKAHSLGAKAYHYVQGFWVPDSRSYDGIDISQHPDWRYCNANGPVLGRVLGSVNWWMLDMNEKAARNAMTAYLLTVKNTWGYDGVFIDLGNAALKPSNMVPGFDINQASTCTQTPVIAGRSFADSYIGMASQAKGVGLESMLNYYNPYQNPVLPAGWWTYLTSTLDESSNQSADWSTVQTANALAQNNGKVVAMVKNTDADAVAAKNDVYFRWSRAKLYDVPVAVNTGDDKCGSSSQPICLHFGVYPELVNTNLGNAQNEAGLAEPAKSGCDAGSDVNACLWVRHYANGLVIDNNSAVARSLTTNLNTSSCMYIKEIYSNQILANNTCVTSIQMNNIPPNSGRVLQYSQSAITNPISCDLNGDGVVGTGDLNIMAAHFRMSSGATAAEGDLNGDGAINIIDFSILALHWGQTS